MFLFGNPLHPYTKTLVSSVPLLHKKWAQVEAELAKGGELARGGVFHEMYPRTGAALGRPGERPTLAEAEDDHFVACFELEGEGAR